LRECYDRQSRVQELREKLQASLDPCREIPALLSELSTAVTAHSSVHAMSAEVSSSDVSMASLDTAA
jgi:hypothetical protein